MHPADGTAGPWEKGGYKIGLARLLPLAVCCCRPKSRSVPGPFTETVRLRRRGTLRTDVLGNFDKNENGAVGKEKGCVWARVARSLGGYEAALSSGSPYKCAIC